MNTCETVDPFAGVFGNARGNAFAPKPTVFRKAEVNPNHYRLIEDTAQKQLWKARRGETLVYLPHFDQELVLYADTLKEHLDWTPESMERILGHIGPAGVATAVITESIGATVVKDDGRYFAAFRKDYALRLDVCGVDGGIEEFSFPAGAIGLPAVKAGVLCYLEGEALFDEERFDEDMVLYGGSAIGMKMTLHPTDAKRNDGLKDFLTEEQGFAIKGAAYRGQEVTILDVVMQDPNYFCLVEVDGKSMTATCGEGQCEVTIEFANGLTSPYLCMASMLPWEPLDWKQTANVPTFLRDC